MRDHLFASVRITTIDHHKLVVIDFTIADDNRVARATAVSNLEKLNFTIHLQIRGIPELDFARHRPTHSSNTGPAGTESSTIDALAVFRKPAVSASGSSLVARQTCITAPATRSSVRLGRPAWSPSIGSRAHWIGEPATSPDREGRDRVVPLRVARRWCDKRPRLLARSQATPPR
jgi:hypothetical protein